MSATVRTRLPVAALRRFVTPPAAAQVCELCAAALPAGDHAHVIDGIGDPAGTVLRCACDPCRVVFDHHGAAAGRRRTVPRHVLVDPDHDPASFAALAAPVTVAHVIDHGGRVEVAFPGPAGIAVAEVDPVAWAQVRVHSRLAAGLQPHVEGLLLIDGQAWRVGVDRCHGLTGRLRDRWQGMDGGPPVRAELARTATALDAAATRLVAGGR